MDDEKMRRKNLLDRIRHNHWLMMIICCGIPLILLIILIYVFDLSNKYLFWFVLLLCPIMHYFMMKDMHKNKEDSENKMKDKNKNGRKD